MKSKKKSSDTKKMLKSPCKWQKQVKSLPIQHSYILYTYIQGKAGIMMIITDLTPVLILNNEYTDAFTL